MKTTDPQHHLLDNERGSVLVLTLMLLVILTIIGMAGTQSTFFELQISGNERNYRQTFGAAETGISLATTDVISLGDGNINDDTFERLIYDGAILTRQTLLSDPPTDENPVIASADEPGNGLRNLTTDVRYRSSDAGASLRGSGYSAGKFRAHNYQITSEATSASGGRSVVSVQGYRVGF